MSGCDEWCTTCILADLQLYLFGARYLVQLRADCSLCAFDGKAECDGCERCREFAEGR